jgi:hypothetical protein
MCELNSPMNLREELHSLVDELEVSDAKRRLHLLVTEMDEETVRKILVQVDRIRRRRLEKLGLFI